MSFMDNIIVISRNGDPGGNIKIQLYILGVLICYCIIKWLKYYKIPPNFPPGPPCIPFLGSVPFIRVG